MKNFIYIKLLVLSDISDKTRIFATIKKRILRLNDRYFVIMG